MGILRDLGGWHLIVILLIVVLLFGATKLPIFAKGLGQSIRIFRKEMHEVKTDIDGDRAADAAARPAEPVYTTTEPPTGSKPAEDAAGTTSARPGSPDR